MALLLRLGGLHGIIWVTDLDLYLSIFPLSIDRPGVWLCLESVPFRVLLFYFHKPRPYLQDVTLTSSSVRPVPTMGSFHPLWMFLFYSPAPVSCTDLNICSCPGGCPFGSFIFVFILPFPPMRFLPHRWVEWWHYNVLFYWPFWSIYLILV